MSPGSGTGFGAGVGGSVGAECGVWEGGEEVGWEVGRGRGGRAAGKRSSTSGLLVASMTATGQFLQALAYAVLLLPTSTAAWTVLSIWFAVGGLRERGVRL